jgi:glycosyltransferase involved in cell wall biosynthesis
MISGAAIGVQELATTFAQRGYQVMVLAASDLPYGYVEQAGALQVIRLPSWNNPARAQQRFMIWPYRELRRYLKEFRPDVIHLHEPLSVGLCGLWAARRLQIPVALTLHQLPWFVSAYLPDLPSVRSEVEAALWRYGGCFLRHCAAVIAPTNTIADIVHQHQNPRPQVIGYSIDVSRFKPQPSQPDEAEILRRRYDLSSRLPVLLHVGRIDVEKQV